MPSPDGCKEGRGEGRRGAEEGRKREVKWDFKSTFVLTDISQTTLRPSPTADFELDTWVALQCVQETLDRSSCS